MWNSVEKSNYSAEMFEKADCSAGKPDSTEHYLVEKFDSVEHFVVKTLDLSECYWAEKLDLVELDYVEKSHFVGNYFVDSAERHCFGIH